MVGPVSPKGSSALTCVYRKEAERRASSLRLLSLDFCAAESGGILALLIGRGGNDALGSEVRAEDGNQLTRRNEGSVAIGRKLIACGIEHRRDDR